MSLIEGGFSGAVLAGGRSTRMGADKAFLRIGGEWLIERQLRCLSGAGAGELLISGRNGVDYSSFKGEVVYDQHADAGPLAGTAAALNAASYPLVLVLAVDMPAMTAEMLTKILSRCKQGSGCVPIVQDLYQPLAAAYPKRLLRAAERLLNGGRYSMRRFVAEAAADGSIQPMRLDASERPCFLNWNRPSDWPPQAG